MQLKKINPHLQQALVELGLVEANEIQEETFSVLKSGADVVIQAEKGAGKTTTLVLNVIQKLEKAHLFSPRALVFAENKEKVLYYSEIIIKIDIQKAKSLGIKFIKSDNNYILSSDIIPPECLSLESK